MESYDGTVMTGHTNEDEEFVLTNIKHMDTESIFSKEQLMALHEYLERQYKSGEPCTMILNDQLPVPLKEEELSLLLEEMEQVIETLQDRG